MATKPQPDDSRHVTAVFNSADAAERGYRAAKTLGYEDADINVVTSDATRDRLLADGGHPNLSNDAAHSKENPAKGTDLGGPTGGTLGTIAPVIAAVGAAVLVPGLVFAGPIAIALTAAGAVGVAGGLIGALKDWGIPQDRVKEYESAVRKGAILVGVKTRSDEDAQKLEQQWRAEGGR
jgi:hypothetical protein